MKKSTMILMGTSALVALGLTAWLCYSKFFFKWTLINDSSDAVKVGTASVAIGATLSGKGKQTVSKGAVKYPDISKPGLYRVTDSGVVHE